MVKRPKSPDPTDDARYLVVYHPFPLNANWELSADYISFAFWVASIIGKEPLLGIHYKPRARSMVLLEIDKQFPDHGRLLGEHRWSEFLKDPSSEEEGRVSQIFYCLYSSGREAQKDGWKRIHVENQWFTDRRWSQENPRIMFPYPETHWCPQPPEDPTNKPLCRPLPVAVKPPPPAAPPLVPGSAQWVAKQTGAQTTPQQLQGAWASRAKPSYTPVILRSQTTSSVPLASSLNKKPIISTSIAGPSKSAWNNAGNTLKTPNSPAPPAQPSTSAWGNALKVTPVSPPSVSSTPSNHPDAPPGLTRDPSRAPGSANISQIQQVFVELDIAKTSQAAAFFDLEDELEEDADPDELERAYVAPWEKEVASAIPTGNMWVTANNKDEGGVIENLWGDDTMKKTTEPEAPLCPYHGVLCKKGICEERKRMERELAKGKAAQNGRGKRPLRGRGWNTTSGASDSKSPSEADADGFSVPKRSARGKYRGG